MNLPFKWGVNVLVLLIFGIKPLVAQNFFYTNGIGGEEDQFVKYLTPISFHYENVPFKEALSDFSNRTGIVLVYSMEQDKLDQLVTASVASQPPLLALQQLLHDTGYSILLVSSGRVVLVPSFQKIVRRSVINGMVYDKLSEEPIPSVNIYLKELGIGTVTNDEGVFKLQNIPLGSYTIRASHIGYETVERQIALSSADPHTEQLLLDPAIFKLGDIFINDKLGSQEAGGLSISGTRIESEQIDRSGGMWIGQVLRSRIAGLTFFENGLGGGLGYLQFRGVGSFYNPIDYVRINIDGIPVDGIYWETFITDNLSRIEVLRGPQASGRYGTSAMSGVINLFTDTGKEGTIDGRISAAGGFATNTAKDFAPFWQEYFGAVGGGTELVTSAITIRHSRDDGILVDKNSRLTAVTAGTRINPSDNLEIRGSFRFSELTSGWPYTQNIQHLLSHPIVNPDVSSHQQRGIGSINVSYNMFSWWEQTLTAGAEYLQGTLDYLSDLTEFTLRRYLSDDERWTSIVERNIHLRPTVHYNTKFFIPMGEQDYGTFSFGVEIQREDRLREVRQEYDKISEELLKVDAVQTIIGKYASWSFHSTSKLDVVVGFRMDEIRAEGQVFYYPVSPSLNVGYRFDISPHWLGILRGSVGRGIRYPHYQMIFGRPPVELPNPDLKAEVMDGWEVGITNYLLDGNISITTTYFAQETKDAFQPVPDLDDPNSYKWVNAGILNNNGLEVELLVRANEWLQFGLTHISHWNRIIDYREDEPYELTQFRVPDWAGSFFMAMKPWKSLTVNFDAYYVGKLLDVDIEAWNRGNRLHPLTDYERIFPPSVKIDFSSRLIVYHKHEVFLNVFNVFNETTRDFTGILPTGRMIIFGARYYI